MKILELISGVLMLLGGLLCFANWFSVYQSWRTKKFHSAIPIFGAVMLGGGMLLLPATRGFAWLAILFDYGTLALIIASPRLWREFWSTSQFNLLHEYAGQSENTNVCLRLFRKGVFTLRLSFVPKEKSGLLSIGNPGTWSLEGEKLQLRSHTGERAMYQICKTSDSEELKQIDGFSKFESQVKISVSSLKLFLNPKTSGLLPR